MRQRLLLTYRVDPQWLRAELPLGFEPTIIDGAALGGLCLLQWRHLRPVGLPAAVGITTVGVAERWFAHRTGRQHVSGVVIPRRWMHGRTVTTATRSLTGGNVTPSSVRFLRHGAQLGARASGTGLGLDVDVAPGDHAPTAVHGGDADMIDAVHATAVRGWTARADGGVHTSELRVTGAWQATPARPVRLVQDVLPDHARFDHALVMQDVAATLRPVSDPARPLLAADRSEVTHG